MYFPKEKEDSVITMMVKELQERLAEYGKNFDSLTGRKQADVPTVMIHLMEELGELASQVYSDMSGRGKINMQNVKEEMADILILLCGLADKHGIDLEQAVTEKMENDMKRLNVK